MELEAPLREDAEPPVLLATGGFAGRLAPERGLLLRANPWSDGDGLDFAVARGAATTAGMGEFYGRAMPAPPARIREEDFVPLAQLYGRDARVFTDDWREITPPQVAWHENDLAQLIGPSAWYVVAATNDRIEAARAAGGTVLQRDEGIAVHVAEGRPIAAEGRIQISGERGVFGACQDDGDALGLQQVAQCEGDAQRVGLLRLVDLVVIGIRHTPVETAAVAGVNGDHDRRWIRGVHRR